MNWKIILAVGAIFCTGAVYAQTPDGQTPVDEAVCDGLKADGVTKGLYGLCVAFCEAQDYADELDSITDEELITLETSTPSGRVLANYNKKKQDGDPDMPCILVQEPCPCWTSAELAAIDGTLWDGYDTPNLICRDRLEEYYGYAYIYERRDQYPYDLQLAEVFDYPTFTSCRYHAVLSPGNVSRDLSVQYGTLTLDEFDSCVTALIDHKATYIGTKYCDE